LLLKSALKQFPTNREKKAAPESKQREHSPGKQRGKEKRIVNLIVFGFIIKELICSSFFGDP
jgi:hypothetical protein